MFYPLIGSEIVVVITLTGRIDRADIQSPDLKVLTVRTRQTQKETPPTALRNVTVTENKSAYLTADKLQSRKNIFCILMNDLVL